MAGNPAGRPNKRENQGTMDALRYEKLTVGILVKREAGVFGPRGLGIFYDPTRRIAPADYRSAFEEYEEETVYGKHSRIGGKHKYPNVDPLTVADLYRRTLNAAGIRAEEPIERPLSLGLEGNRGYIVRFPMEDLERGRSIFEFLSTMYYDHRHILTSFIYLDRAKQKCSDQAAVVTLGPDVRVFHAERFQPIYLGGTEPVDGVTVDKSSLALEFYHVGKRHLEKCMDTIKAGQDLFCLPFEDLPADQVAYAHSVMWDSKDLPRGYRANFIRRGLGGFKARGIGELVAYSLFPVQMKTRLVESLHLLRAISLGSPDLLRDFMAVNRSIREVVPDEFFADIAFRE